MYYRVDLTGKQYFDGKNIPGPTSKYQLSEVTDPDITPLIHKRQYMRSEPNVSFYLHSFLNNKKRSN
jgi:hypothetical protein